MCNAALYAHVEIPQPRDATELNSDGNDGSASVALRTALYKSEYYYYFLNPR